MPKISNVSVSGLDRAYRTAKYPKSTDIEKLNNDLTDGIRACGTCRPGEAHDNFLKGIVVHFDMTFSEKAWPEAQRYHFLEFVSSQSLIHKVSKLNPREQCNKYVDERCISVLEEKINAYNNDPDPEKYLEILYNVPSGYELTAGMVTNYQALKTMYHQRRYHILPDWQEFCNWVETLPDSFLITENDANKILSFCNSEETNLELKTN